MSFKSTCLMAYRSVQRPHWLLLALLLCASAIVFYPSDLSSYDVGGRGDASQLTLASEDYIRFVNVAAPIALLMVHRDVIGLAQIGYVSIVATVATHGLKRLSNNWQVQGTRLGQRPASSSSKHNMPSGHSSLASCGAFFVCRRYGWKWALLTVPVLLLTMWARVDLSDHTVSAVIVGALIGLIVCISFVSSFWHQKELNMP